MASKLNRKSIDTWRGKPIPAGESSDVFLPVSESYSGISLKIPIRIQRGEEDGPVILITAALHGDELNGTGVIRELICDEGFQLKRGALIMVPILNLLAFDRHSRYLPDRRDLNRCFPGSLNGSLAGRIARQIFNELIGRADIVIDLHTASVRRTNYPSIRGDMSDPAVRDLAIDFGCEVIIDGRGPKGSLRREACRAGCPAIVMEGGEVWKVEPAIVATAVRGIKNILHSKGMIEGETRLPEAQAVIDNTRWVRAERGGFLQFHVRPGQLIEKNQPLATNSDLLGHENRLLISPFNGVILGMTTLPAVSPGEPVCHIGELPHGPSALRESRSETQGLETQAVKELASNVLVVKREPEDPEPEDPEAE